VNEGEKTFHCSFRGTIKPTTGERKCFLYLINLRKTGLTSWVVIKCGRLYIRSSVRY